MTTRVQSPEPERKPSKPSVPLLVGFKYSRSPIPYAPRNRRTPAASVLKPLTQAELDAYRNPRNNPLRDRSLKRKIEAVDLDDRVKAEPETAEPPAKRSKDVGLVVSHCTS